MSFWGELWGKVKTWFRFPEGATKREFDVTSAISREAMQNIDLWYSLYLGEAPWKTHDVISLNIPASICREMARPTLSELQVNIEGGGMADYMMQQFLPMQDQLLPALQLFLALGGGALKPYLFGNRILLDYCGMNAFQPTKFNAAGECVGATFRELTKVENQYYVRLENHLLEGGRYIVQNRAFESSQSGSVGSPVSMDAVPEWADIEEDIFIDNIEYPLFAYFKTPIQNKLNPSSGVGVSVYADAIELIRQADVQWERLQWEFKSGERKIFGDRSEMNIERFGKDRLYAFGPFFSDNGSLYHEFSPEFRDANLCAGFQNILKQIEFNVGLAFGTISDPMSVERTATEVESTKQRMFTTIEGIKRNMETALDNLIYAMSVYARLYNLAPAGDYTVTYEWGDSILEDTASKQLALADMRNDVAAGLIRGELYVAKKYGVTEKEALDMMPQMDTMATEQEEEIE